MEEFPSFVNSVNSILFKYNNLFVFIYTSLETGNIQGISVFIFDKMSVISLKNKIKQKHIDIVNKQRKLNEIRSRTPTYYENRDRLLYEEEHLLDKKLKEFDNNIKKKKCFVEQYKKILTTDRKALGQVGLTEKKEMKKTIQKQSSMRQTDSKVPKESVVSQEKIDANEIFMNDVCIELDSDRCLFNIQTNQPQKTVSSAKRQHVEEHLSSAESSPGNLDKNKSDSNSYADPSRGDWSQLTMMRPEDILKIIQTHNSEEILRYLK